ncbi:hypothetical protein M413DRAFT_440165 [Hebeloma cylindrosporum]|uniref:Copper transport protein n=1 Tax=Hebeloma cylindrosporum TaxID=76867 RepID=A0A0C2YFA0_HEBCY|nr:hypothetical protein M413DRAFT_440165 [Hebeloma cylindrosporum h7]
MAHSDHGGSTTPSSSSSHAGMMIPYFHFAVGDSLFFESWQPRSAGALAGACLGLIVLCLFERWLAATRNVFNKQWRQRALDLTASHDLSVASQRISPSSKTDSSETKELMIDGIQEISEQQLQPPAIASGSQGRTVKSRSRTIPPFIVAHDVPRGILYAAQVLVVYLLMLAIMTFQAAYFISIVLGLGIGETIFGRVGTVDAGH